MSYFWKPANISTEFERKLATESYDPGAWWSTKTRAAQTFDLYTTPGMVAFETRVANAEKAAGTYNDEQWQVGWTAGEEIPNPHAMTEEAFKSKGYDRGGAIKWTPRMTEQRAQITAEEYDKRQHDNAIMERTSTPARTALGFGAALIASLPDPINLIPVGGPAAKGASIGARMLAGAKAGAVGTALADAVVLPAARARGEDVGFGTMALDMTFGALFGGAIGAGGHWLHNRRVRSMAPQEEALGKAFTDMGFDAAEASRRAHDVVNVLADTARRTEKAEAVRSWLGGVNRQDAGRLLDKAMETLVRGNDMDVASWAALLRGHEPVNGESLLPRGVAPGVQRDFAEMLSAVEKEGVPTVNFGKLSPDRLAALQAIERAGGMDILRDGQLVLPSNVVWGIFNRGTGVLRGHHTADQLADALIDAIRFDRNAPVPEGGKSLAKSLTKMQDDLIEKGFLERDKDTGNVRINAETSLGAERKRLIEEMVGAGENRERAESIANLHVAQALAFQKAYGVDAVKALGRRSVHRGMNIGEGEGVRLSQQTDRMAENATHAQEGFNSYGVPNSRVTPLESISSIEEAVRLMEQLAGIDLENLIEGVTAQVNSTQRGKMTSRKTTGKSVQNGFSPQEHRGASTAIENIWRWSAEAWRGADQKNGKKNVEIRRYVAAVKVGGDDAFAWITVKKTDSGLRLYSVELMKSEKLRENVSGRGLKPGATLSRSFDEIIERLNKPVNKDFQDLTAQGLSKSMDAEYMAAVERGDLETAQRMVNERAAQMGYSTESDYRMSHEAPSSKYDDEMSNLRGLALGDDIELVSESYWEHPEHYIDLDDGFSVESFNAIKGAIDDLRAGGDGEITVYRAVPTDVKEGSFRNASWVTPSKAYAEGHIEHALNGKGRIIEQRVKADNLWWDAELINEWGFDDRNSYAYRNTRNNRKLLDAVTRDENGNVIPLSKRFNYRKQSVLYQGDNVGPRGLVDISNPEPGSAGETYRIFLGPNADASTVPHESAHIFHRELENVVARGGEGANIEQARADLKAIRRYAGVAEEGKLSADDYRKVQEAFARGFEQYLYEGKAPNAALEGVFRRMARWLSSIYEDIKRYVAGTDGVELKDEIRQVYDRMLDPDRWNAGERMDEFRMEGASPDYSRPAPLPEVRPDTVENLERASDDILNEMGHSPIDYEATRLVEQGQVSPEHMQQLNDANAALEHVDRVEEASLAAVECIIGAA